MRVSGGKKLADCRNVGGDGGTERYIVLEVLRRPDLFVKCYRHLLSILRTRGEIQQIRFQYLPFRIGKCRGGILFFAHHDPRRVDARHIRITKRNVYRRKTECRRAFCSFLDYTRVPLHAEEVGFEPTRPFDLAVFKTAGINRYPTPPTLLYHVCRKSA